MLILTLDAIANDIFIIDCFFDEGLLSEQEWGEQRSLLEAQFDTIYGITEEIYDESPAVAF